MGCGARAAGGRGPPGRRRHGQGAPARRRGARGRGADRVLVLDRELAAPAGRGRGADGACSPSGSSARHQSSTPRACGCASSAAAKGSPPIWSSGWSGPRRRPQANDADHALRRLQLRRQGGDRRRGEKLRGRLGGRVPRPPLRARDARPRPPDPDQRRAADLELPALAVRLLGARLLATRCGPTSTARRSRPRWASTRTADAGSEGARRWRDRVHSIPRSTSITRGAPGRSRRRRCAAERGRRTRRAPAAQAAPPALRDARPDRLGAPVDRDRGHDRDHRRRAVRSGDDRLRLRRHPRVLPDDPRRPPVPAHSVRGRRGAGRRRLLRRPVPDDDRAGGEHPGDLPRRRHCARIATGSRSRSR